MCIKFVIQAISLNMQIRGSQLKYSSVAMAIRLSKCQIRIPWLKFPDKSNITHIL